MCRIIGLGSFPMLLGQQPESQLVDPGDGMLKPNRVWFQWVSARRRRIAIIVVVGPGRLTASLD